MTATPITAIDLDAERSDRAKARAAQHEGNAETLPVRFGGKTIAELPAEFPLSVLAPLTEIDVDVAYVIRSVVNAAQATARDQQIASANLLVDVLAANPSMPAGLLRALTEISRRLLGDEGYEAFTALSPTPWDVRALARGVLGWYGTSLGEFSLSTSSPAAAGGETSKPTSSATTGKTRGASGKRRVIPASSEPAGS